MSLILASRTLETFWSDLPPFCTRECLMPVPPAPPSLLTLSTFFRILSSCASILATSSLTSCDLSLIINSLILTLSSLSTFFSRLANPCCVFIDYFTAVVLDSSLGLPVELWDLFYFECERKGSTGWLARNNRFFDGSINLSISKRNYENIAVDNYYRWRDARAGRGAGMALNVRLVVKSGGGKSVESTFGRNLG